MRKALGWIVVEDVGEGYTPVVYVEWVENGQRKREDQGRGERGCALAVEWWEKKLGGEVELVPTLRGLYRVYLKEPS